MPSEKFGTKFQISGYGGLHYTKHRIIRYIPEYIEHFVEPFAGLGRISKLVVNTKYPKHVVLNDLSDMAVETLRKECPTAQVTQEDFVDCIKKWDSPSTFFFIDPAWRKNIYKNHEAPVFNRKNVIQYYDEIFELLRKTSATWILTIDQDEHEIGSRVSKSGYQNIVLEADDGQGKFFGRLARVRMCTNCPSLFINNLNRKEPKKEWLA